MFSIASLPPMSVPGHFDDLHLLESSRNMENLRLGERIRQALHAAGYSALRDIHVHVDSRIVQLVGRVPSYYMKQIAQSVAQAILKWHELKNDLVVGL